MSPTPPPKINLRDLPELEQRSPTGKFHSFAKNVSVALGTPRNVGVWGGGHPFDFQIRRIPPGTAVCPHHAHIVQWEFFHVLRGTGTVRAGDTRHAIRAGDNFLHPPGEAHQLINTGTEDLEVFIVADNPPLDGFYYPDSDKWGLRTPSVFFKMTPVDYFEGEDTVVAAPGSAPALTPPATPFTQRLRHTGDIAWEDWQSPKGKFRGSFRGVSLAFGAQHKTPVGLGGHPFDVEFGKVPAGATLFPFHAHTLQWEFYFFTAGCGEFRLRDERFAVEPGDCVVAPPGAPHTFANTGHEELHYCVIADDHVAETWEMPESRKTGFSNPRRFVRTTEVDYLDGEE